MLTNEDYLQRWEDAAPEAVAGLATEEEIKKSQGTRNSEENPWETYTKEMEQEDPAMLAAIQEYASRVSEAKPSSETEDSYLERKENNDKNSQQYQWLSPEEYADEGERMGQVMHSSSFILKLLRAGVNCWYRQHPQEGKITLIVQREDLEPEVGCWVQVGFMPELSVMKFDDHGIPLDEKFRGWRTALLQLILKSAISEEKADEVFGSPDTTPAFHRYNSTLQMFRNAGSRLED